MKTQEQQKADLLDEYMSRRGTISQIGDTELNIRYKAITAQKPLTADPYADEIFSKRIVTALQKHFYGDSIQLRLSECPKVDYLLKTGLGFGRKSREEYIEVMKKYGFNDKI